MRIRITTRNPRKRGGFYAIFAIPRSRPIFEEFGNSAPLLLLHGNTVSSKMFAGIAVQYGGVSFGEQKLFRKMKHIGTVFTHTYTLASGGPVCDATTGGRPSKTTLEGMVQP